MACETIEDIFNRIRRFHKELSDFYQKLNDTAQQERVKMLLDYLQQHEKNLEESLASYQTEVSNNILKTWFKFHIPDELHDTCCKQLSIENKLNASTDEIVALALKLDDCLINLCSMIIEKTDIPEIRDVFTNLLNLEKKQEMQLARNSLTINDI